MIGLSIDETIVKKNPLYPPCQVLRKERTLRGWSQTELAIKMQEIGYTNISPSIICKFEKGRQKPWRSAIELMCKIFNMDQSALFPEMGDHLG